MADLNIPRQKMNTLNPEIRKNNFDEVSLGYTEQQAINEAKRCLDCKKKPCMNGCPVQIDIPLFIKYITEKKFLEAYQVVLESNSLPAISGRVCPQETQCEKYCVRGLKGEPVAIGRLERFVADYNRNIEFQNRVVDKKKYKVAIIGSGPAGLSCASVLAKMGYEVTIFEALHVAGGVLVYGIPEFRLPKKIVNKEINDLLKLGVKIETDVVIGKTITIDDLKSKYGFDAFFIGSGAGLPKFMGIPGENLVGVFSANEFLTRINLMKAYEENSYTPIYKGNNIAVVGGGNVAMDAARCARRLGANVTIIYRRTEKELPARLEEIHHAKEEGINFRFLVNPIEIIGESNKVVSIKCIEMKLGQPDSSGRAKPIPIENSEFLIDVDTVIMALGTSPNPIIKNSLKELQTDKKGIIIVDENNQTSLEGVYAGGDAVTGAATVILAMGAGKKSAIAIDYFLNKLKE